MDPLLSYACTLWSLQRARWRVAANRDDGAMSTELAIVTFLLAGLAITVVGIIVYKTLTKANAIPVE